MDAWFDGSCALCRRARDWAAARDRHGRLVFRDASTPEGRAMLSAIDPALPNRAAAELLVVGPGGRIDGGLDAVRAMLRVLPWWRGAGALLGVPPVRWIARKIYRVVARHRHGLAGADCGCDADAAPRRRSHGGSR